MSAVGRARAWLRAVTRRDRTDREMREEMEAHIAQAAARLMARGMSAADALLEARREFGHVGELQNAARDARGGQWVESLVADLRYALRYFARTPLSAVTIVLTLALGIGFSSAVFSTLNGVLTRPAPGVPADQALVKIRGLVDVPRSARLFSWPELSAYAGLTNTFEQVAGWATSAVVVDLGDREHGVTSARGIFVTPNYFSTLGVRLAAGRSFAQTGFDAVAPPELSAIVTDAFAAELFGGARDALGKRVQVNGVEVAIIGVAPPRFNGPVQSGRQRTVWLPLSSYQLLDRLSGDVFTARDNYAFDALARLAFDVSVDEATAAVRVVAARFDADARAQRREWTGTADVVALRGLIDVSGRYDNELAPTALLMSAIAILVLLMCTTTVNSLLVGAAVARRYEIGVRLALGASRARIVRQLLTEIGILSLAGGALGMWVFGVLGRLTEVAQDGFEVSPDWSTTGFTVFYAILTATLCGLSPALHATRTGVADVLKDNTAGAMRKSRLQRTFVVAQITIAQPLMVILAAVMWTVFDAIPTMTNVTLRERVLIADLGTVVADALKEPDRIPKIVQRISTVPGVETVLPIGLGQGTVALERPDARRTGDSIGPRHATIYDVPVGYFGAVDARIVAGRDLAPGDSTLPVTPAIINATLALELFGSANPIGQRLRRPSRQDEPARELEVVGVVSMERETNTLEYPSDYPPVFVPIRGRHPGRLLIRTTGPADKLIPAIMAIVREEAPMVPLERVRTLAHADRLRRESRLQAFVAVAGCGLIALLLGAVGLYAMLSIAVGQRRREIGVRMALGARAGEVVTMFFASGLRVALLGLALGLPLSVAGLALVAREFGIVWTELPVIAGLVVLSVLIVASLASWLPARRAATANPMLALRSE